MARDEEGLAQAERAHEPTPEPARARGWRGWLPLLIKPLRRGVLIFVLILIVEYLVVPELVGASKDLHLLGQVNPYWLIAGDTSKLAFVVVGNDAKIDPALGCGEMGLTNVTSSSYITRYEM